VKRAVRHAVACFTTFGMASCASSGGPGGASAAVELTRVGEAVSFTEDAERTHECEFITDLPLASKDPSDVNGMRTLRNQAGIAGANLILLVMESRTSIERAEGYLCAD